MLLFSQPEHVGLGIKGWKQGGSAPRYYTNNSLTEILLFILPTISCAGLDILVFKGECFHQRTQHYTDILSSYWTNKLYLIWVLVWPVQCFYLIFPLLKFPISLHSSKYSSDHCVFTLSLVVAPQLPVISLLYKKYFLFYKLTDNVELLLIIIIKFPMFIFYTPQLIVALFEAIAYLYILCLPYQCASIGWPWGCCHQSHQRGKNKDYVDKILKVHIFNLELPWWLR